MTKNLKNLFMCFLISMLFCNCFNPEVPFNPTENIQYSAHHVVEHDIYCAIELDKYPGNIDLCDTYTDSECCVWLYEDVFHSCETERCFFYDACAWELIDTECQ
jgi:hypothetical protein